MYNNMNRTDKKVNRANYRSLFRRRTQNDDDAELSESIINSVRKTGQLDLSAKGLATVPGKVWTINQLTSEELERLDMKLNFDDDKERWWEYEPLKTLNLSSNSLTKLDSRVELLSELTVLDLHDNAVNVLPPEIGKLKQLRNFNASSNKIENLPSSMYELSELRSMDLSNNLLKELHPSVGDLVMLEYMNLSCNNLTELPVGLGYLVRLVCLDLSHNMLKELPPDITSMRELKKLDASFNQLEIVPPMGELRRMEVLILHTNNLSRSPDTNGCTGLRELHLGNNKISSVDVLSLESMAQLKTLNLGNNEIKSIPDEIVQLCNIERLDFSNNSIETIPARISLMPKLQTLFVDGNNIKNVRRDVIQCGTARLTRYLRETIQSEDSHSQLNFRSFSGNTDHFPDKYVLRNTRSLNLANQNRCEIPETVAIDAADAKVTCIDLTKNKFTELPDTLSAVSTVKELKLSKNQLTRLPDWIGEKYQHLQFLDISNNHLFQLPDSISTLNYLREINMSYNRYTQIPECIYELAGLEILIANNNQIELIDVKSLSKLQRLANLDMSNNNIAFVPPELGNMQHIRSLGLSGNCFKQPRHATLAKGTEEILAYLRDRITS